MIQNNPYATLPKPFFALAPMDDVTDTVFRQIIATLPDPKAVKKGRDGEVSGYGPDLYFTEFVNVDGLESVGKPNLMKKLQFTANERPLIAQIWGLNPDNFYKVAQHIADGSYAREFGLPEGVNFAGVDLNMGCPAKSEVQNGACSALINNRPLAQDIIKATQEGLAGRLPLSVKTRLGFSQIDFTWHEFLLGQKLNMLTIHGRTRKEMSKVPVHWPEIAHIVTLRDKLCPETLIVGNGDIATRAEGFKLAKKYNLDGVMIGRGVFSDPYVFAQDSPWPTLTRQQRIDLYANHVKLFDKTWQNNERRVVTLNKFCKVYIQNFTGAKELREKLMNAQTTDELVALLEAA